MAIFPALLPVWIFHRVCRDEVVFFFFAEGLPRHTLRRGPKSAIFTENKKKAWVGLGRGPQPPPLPVMGVTQGTPPPLPWGWQPGVGICVCGWWLR